MIKHPKALSGFSVLLVTILVFFVAPTVKAYDVLYDSGPTTSTLTSVPTQQLYVNANDPIVPTINGVENDLMVYAITIHDMADTGSPVPGIYITLQENWYGTFCTSDTHTIAGAAHDETFFFSGGCYLRLEHRSEASVVMRGPSEQFTSGRIAITNPIAGNYGGAMIFYGPYYPYQVDSNNVSLDTTWSGRHLISGNIAVDSGVTLTIQPGTVIKFDTATSSSLSIDGTLDAAVATSSEGSTFFTSYKDDLIGGDTNGDASSTSPAAGDWGGVTINSGGSANFAYSVIRYGGAGSVSMIHNNGGTLTIASSTVAYGDGYGIENSSGTTTISASDISFNTDGLYLGGGSADISASSTIHDNSSYGVFNNTTNTIGAENTYWGDSSGPYHSTNPTGLGNAVSDYVDFIPWIGTSTLHYVETDDRCPSSTCASVRNQALVYLASTTYSTEFNAAVSTWGNKVSLVASGATSTAPNVKLDDVYEPDVVWKGEYADLNLYPTTPDPIQLNTYYLDSQTSDEIQNTITHELGHALGLNHSYTGNIMYFAQSTQTNLGPQDMSDFNYLWP